MPPYDPFTVKEKLWSDPFHDPFHVPRTDPYADQ